MCGRYVLTTADALVLIQALADLAANDNEAPAAYHQQQPPANVLPENHNGGNIAPGRRLPIVTSLAPLTVVQAAWGLIPSRTPAGLEKPNHFELFNARADNLLMVHARLLRSHRCVVPASGFYEWHKPTVGGRVKEKQPYFVTSDSSSGLLFAGLHDTWARADGSTLTSFSIITVDPAENLKWLHDRNPLILPLAGAKQWLADVPFQAVVHLLTPMQTGLRWWPVTRELGKLQYQAADCTKPVDLRGGAKPITSYFKPAAQASADDADEDVFAPIVAASSSPSRKRTMTDYFKTSSPLNGIAAPPSRKRAHSSPSTASTGPAPLDS